VVDVNLLTRQDHVDYMQSSTLITGDKNLKSALKDKINKSKLSKNVKHIVQVPTSRAFDDHKLLLPIFIIVLYLL